MNIPARILCGAVFAILALVPAQPAPSQTPNDARSKCPQTPGPIGTPQLSARPQQPRWVSNGRNVVRWFSDIDPFPAAVSLKVTGHRLGTLTVPEMALGDALVPKFSEPPVNAQWKSKSMPNIKQGTRFILSALEFPTPGCWEIAARLNDSELRFVIYVEQGRRQ